MSEEWELIRKLSFEIDPMASVLSLAALSLGVWNRVTLWRQKKKDWRLTVLCERVDEVCDKAYSYWTMGESPKTSTQTKRLAVDLKMLLRDIEEQSAMLDIDFGSHITQLREAITSGKFEESDRKAVGVDDDKYCRIQTHAQEIRNRLMST